MSWHRQTDEVNIKRNKLSNLNYVPSERAKPTLDPGNTNVHRPSLLKLLWAQYSEGTFKTQAVT